MNFSYTLIRFLDGQKPFFWTPKVIYQGSYYNVMGFILGHGLTYEEYHGLTEKEQDMLAQDEARFLHELHGLCV